jgi:hypothetical protein
MKNLIKLFVVVLAMSFVFISCEKGGTIEVINSSGYPNMVLIVEGLNIAGIDPQKNGTQLAEGAKKTFTYTEDGTYTVVAAYPLGFFKTVILLGGSSERVTIK